MAYVLGDDFGKDDGTSDYLKNFQQKWKEYYSYLETIKNQIPKSAYRFAKGEWHYNFNDSKFRMMLGLTM